MLMLYVVYAVGRVYVESAPQMGGVPQTVATLLCCVVAVGGIARDELRLLRDDLARLGVWPRE